MDKLGENTTFFHPPFYSLFLSTAFPYIKKEGSQRWKTNFPLIHIIFLSYYVLRIS